MEWTDGKSEPYKLAKVELNTKYLRPPRLFRSGTTRGLDSFEVASSSGRLTASPRLTAPTLIVLVAGSSMLAAGSRMFAADSRC